MSGEVNGACTGSNPQICDPLPNGNSQLPASSRAGSLGGVVDDLYQDYRGIVYPYTSSLSSKPANSMSTAQVIAKYGPMKDWDMSLVTDISYLFYNKKTMNADLSSWDVSGVTNMQEST